MNMNKQIAENETLDSLSKKLNISISDLSKIIDIPEIDCLQRKDEQIYSVLSPYIKLADFLGLSLDDLIGRCSKLYDVDVVLSGWGLTYNDIEAYSEEGAKKIARDLFCREKPDQEIEAILIQSKEWKYMSLSSITFDKKAIGQRVKYLRKINDIRQDSLAAKLGISYQLLSNIETGYRNITLDLVIAICKHFNVTTDYLLGLSDYYNPSVIDAINELSAENKLLKKKLKNIIKIAESEA